MVNSFLGNLHCCRRYFLLTDSGRHELRKSPFSCFWLYPALAGGFLFSRVEQSTNPVNKDLLNLIISCIG